MQFFMLSFCPTTSAWAELVICDSIFLTPHDTGPPLRNVAAQV